MGIILKYSFRINNNTWIIDKKIKGILTASSNSSYSFIVRDFALR